LLHQLFVFGGAHAGSLWGVSAAILPLQPHYS
jgi:hypothetical protein